MREGIKAPKGPTWDDSVEELRTQKHLKAKRKPVQRADGEVYIEP